METTAPRCFNVVMPERRLNRLVSLAAALAIAYMVGGTSCSRSSSTLCADGLRCPAGLVCVPGHARCAAAEPVNACFGKFEGDPCQVAGATGGRCRDGVCSGDLGH